MRSDMAKVIVERPRYGSGLPTKGKGYERRRQRVAWEDQPKREGIKVRGGGRKALNEHLSPLRRYLERKVGQRWDKIFADVCRYLDRNSAVQDHVRDHLEDYVATCVIVVDGVLCHGDGYGIGRALHSLFYVCPRTGVLRKNRRPRAWWRMERPAQPHIRFIDHLTRLIREDGVWYILEFRAVPRPTTPPNEGSTIAKEIKMFDVLLGAHVDRADR